MSSTIPNSTREGMLRSEMARRSLLEFGKLVYPKFESPPHLRYIAGLLEKVERGELRRLCVSVPVRSGKSVLCSQIFPAWYLGRNPTQPVILASHAESLAVSFSRQARNIVAGDDWPFPDVKMSSDSTSVQRWHTTAGGSMYAIGTGGAITGRGFALGIIDDPIHDALSQAERNSAWDWFTSVFVPRAEPGAAIVVVAARFAGDDLVGRLMESEYASEWKFVSLPAIAGENDILGREPGEAIWPERMSLAELNDRKQMMGSAAFEAQFGQNPLPAGGITFKKEWFERYVIAPPGLFKVAAIDTAWKSGLRNDPSAITFWGANVKVGDYYLLSAWRARVEYPELKKRVVEMYFEHRPDTILVEEAASGFALTQELRSTSLPIQGIVPRGDKVARAEAVTPLFESGKIKLPVAAPWLVDFERELLAFPAGKHDDWVDTTSLALTYLAERVQRRQYAESQAWRQELQRIERWATYIP